MSTFRLFILTILLCGASQSYAQMYPVSLEERIAASSLVIEGKVIAQESLWDDAKHNIYTLNTLAVAKLFKGELLAEHVLVLTRGGVVGTEKEEVCPSLGLRMGDYGLFTLTYSGVILSEHQETYFAQAGPQGFIQFNTFDGELKGAFESFKNAELNLYPRCKIATGMDFQVLQEIKIDKRGSPSLSKSITSISPTSQTAGTKSTISIFGSDFGSVQGLVAFRNANLSGVQYSATLPSEVIAWSEDEISVEVPDWAGTGQVIIETSAGVQFISSATLQIEYAQTLINYPQVNPSTYRTRMVNESSIAGYTWQMNNDFAANSAAAESFARAMETWVDATCVNWIIGTNTPVDTVMSDNVNVILFDESAALIGAIGRSTSRYSACSSTNPEWYIRELDIVFDESVNWHFGEGPTPSSMTDFQSVATHELGHGHQLGHVIAPGDVMHFQILIGATNREPSLGEIAGATDVMTRSVGAQICNRPSATESSSCCQEGLINALTASENNICPGGSSTITISGNLNDATAWLVYSGSCGGTLEGTASASLTVSPSVTTTYFVRGEDESGCLDETGLSCTSITISVEDATAPDLTCPNNITVQGDLDGNTSLLDYSSLAILADNCDQFPSLTQSPAAGTLITGSSNAITFTATDASANSVSCSFNVEVLVIDSDGDGVTDATDNCPNQANPNQADLDNDLIGDACDDDIDGDGVDNGDDCDPMDASLFEGASCDDGDTNTENDTVQSDCSCAGTLIDTDSDGITDSLDNCPDDANPGQEDLDNDLIGDACDDDIDGDGVTNSQDCDPMDASLFEGESCDDGDTNTENDSVQSDCSCAGTLIDTDSDGITDSLDNCPDDANPGQEDLDNDLIGDACDDDIDGDGVDNGDDCDPLDPLISSCPCEGDLNGDGVIDISDFIAFNSQFGSVCAACDGDINGDGMVDILDFLILNSAFGSSCP